MENIANEERIKELREQWKSLWRERIDDKVRAEAIANRDFNSLFVEKGTIIFATRKFRMLSFTEILQLHGILNVERFVPPHPNVGGWGKFIRTVIANQQFSKRCKRSRQYIMKEKQKQQLKKGGRGWLHII